MEEIKNRITIILGNLEAISKWIDNDIIRISAVQLELYIEKIFGNEERYKNLLNSVNLSPDTSDDFWDAISKLRTLSIALLEDIEISGTVNLEKEKEALLNDYKTELQKALLEDQKRVEESQRVLEKFNIEREEAFNKIKQEREDLLREKEKFDEFKSKLEIADKGIDFQSESKSYKTAAYFWGILGGALIITLLIILSTSLDSFLKFSDIANGIRQKMLAGNNTEELISKTIYIAYFKNLFTRMMIYSIVIYGIVFCFKNYNAQMHNHIVNSHKSNALKSTLSLLDTARSEDGNDKLLIQATQAIFSHQNTGYSSKENEVQSPNLITNVIDAAAKKI